MAISNSTFFTTTLSLSMFLLLSLPSPSLAAAKCNANDKAALLQIKAAMNNAYHFASWDPNTDCCSWYDVTCDSSGRVIRLEIFDDTDVTGSISPAIGNLVYLQEIDINALPKLSGSIPSTITTLTRLTFLRLKGNNLSGPIPTALGNLNKLTFLDLSSNSLTGSIPASVTKLTNLDGFDFSNNSLCGAIPQGGKLQSSGTSPYDNNKCLCGNPLPACS
ncbi:OLC1v1037043C1 [Oldenlandia corymbosa var. corymbosa]|uniref:OLC1v1037043C1 n=1 Tax=Oldenlandia corymbosa var. corymbosa TaxID=529605 RepID=A0AAV1CY62_OLDCO|nr:OLC1v1037043C1 [Oldenlandia corymbosa var. corymbosa]